MNLIEHIRAANACLRILRKRERTSGTPRAKQASIEMEQHLYRLYASYDACQK